MFIQTRTLNAAEVPPHVCGVWRSVSGTASSRRQVRARSSHTAGRSARRDPLRRTRRRLIQMSAVQMWMDLQRVRGQRWEMMMMLKMMISFPVSTLNFKSRDTNRLLLLLRWSRRSPPMTAQHSPKSSVHPCGAVIVFYLESRWQQRERGHRRMLP